uniref:Uncharacterized protein n=1 Tax=Cacopsylla melanoneura TaxID=428564 RepID=A0A8D8SP47_9HEMI
MITGEEFDDISKTSLLSTFSTFVTLFTSGTSTLENVSSHIVSTRFSFVRSFMTDLRTRSSFVRSFLTDLCFLVLSTLRFNFKFGLLESSVPHLFTIFKLSDISTLGSLGTSGCSKSPPKVVLSDDSNNFPCEVFDLSLL